MKRTKGGLPMLAALLACTLLLSGCEPKEEANPVPPAGTSVSTTSEVFRQTATGLAPECARIGCTCILDGIQTTCAIVFACLDAGFCERVATQ